MLEKIARKAVALGGNEVLDQLEKEFPFAGTASFMKLPYGRSIKGADIVIAGIPYDGGTSNRPGARLGPRSVREQSAYATELQPVHPWGYKLRDRLDLRDFGDITPPPGSGCTEIMLGLAESAAKGILAGGASLLVLGGDHSVSYGPIRAAAARFGKLALIHLDAHQDCLPSDGFAPGLRLVNHATFSYDLAAEGRIAPEKSTQAYIRTYMPPIGQNGYMVVHADAAMEMGPEKLAGEIKRRVGNAPAYLSLDIDALDPAYAPGTGTPVPGGPSSAVLRRFLKALEGVNIVAADLVEVNPSYDPAQVTAIAAAYLAIDLIHLLAAARKPA
jgi:agmatinase